MATTISVIRSGKEWSYSIIRKLTKFPEIFFRHPGEERRVKAPGGSEECRDVPEGGIVIDPAEQQDKN